MEPQDFEYYIRAGEPKQRERAQNWATAIGLQAVDGLPTSEYLHEVARRNIEGEITIHEAQQLVKSYYVSRTKREDDARDTEEGDLASAHITTLLSDPSFTFSVAGFTSIHQRIFNGVFKHAGKFRDYDITKREWILRGATVTYSMASELRATVEYDLDREKAFEYKGLSQEEIITHITRFIADLWQIHPFCEGNTRTTAVFLIKYLRSKGYTLYNEPFRQHSWYFRNALVRANYNNLPKGITNDYTFLEHFLSNILLGTSYPLKNRYLHVDWKETEDTSASNTNLPVNLPANLPSKQVRILEFLSKEPHLTYSVLAQRLGCSRETVRVHIKSLSEQGLLERIGSDKTGHWSVIDKKQES